MKLEMLLRGCSLRLTTGDLGIDIIGLAYDSRDVCPGYVFFAIRGTRTNGNRFVPKAIAKGASAIVSASPAIQSLAIPWIQVDDERAALAAMAGNLYEHPTDKL